MKKLTLLLAMTAVLVGGSMQLGANTCRDFCTGEYNNCIAGGGGPGDCKSVYIDCIIHYCL